MAKISNVDAFLIYTAIDNFADKFLTIRLLLKSIDAPPEVIEGAKTAALALADFVQLVSDNLEDD
jgi:hypothetical protein